SDAKKSVLPTLSESVTATVMGSAVGTPGYMPPEQAQGRHDQEGPGSDMYSLGATLYHLLTGQMPFPGKDVKEVLARVIRGDCRPPRQVRPAVPAPLEAVCGKPMAVKAEERYESARALAEEVERWLADEPVSAWAEPLPVRARRWVRKHRVL